MDGLLKKSILILEDEPLIAMDHDVHAGRAGFQNVTMLSSCVAAIDWLRSNTPSVALLDVRLRDGACSEVASLLTQRGIPFVVCSGSTRDDVDPAFRRGIWLPKPCRPEELISALTRAGEKATMQNQEA
jgi:DNA-binding response OmpR family regulator